MKDTTLSQAIETVIQRAFPDHNIRNVSIKAGSANGDNYLGVMHAIEAELEDKNSVRSTKHLVLKTSSSNEARKEFADNLEVFDKEVAFYMDVLPELLQFQAPGKSPVINPAFVKCYHAQTANSLSDLKCDGTPKCVHCQPLLPWDYILMEDMREVGGYKMGDRLTGLDFDHSKLVMSELARFHALSYAYIKSLKSNEELFSKFPNLKESIMSSQNIPQLQKIWNSAVESSLAILRKTYSEESTEYQKLKKLTSGIMSIMSHVVAGSTDLTLDEMLATPVDYKDLNFVGRERKERNQWLTLTHGDSWVNNFLFKYYGDKPIAIKLIDLQVVRELCLTSDLAYFFYMSTTPQMRKEHLNTLLEIYFNTFMSVCNTLKVTPWADFTLENLKLKYKKAALLGASTGLCMLPLVLLPKESAVDLDKDATHENAFGSVFSNGLIENVNLEKRLLATAQECFESGILD